MGGIADHHHPPEGPVVQHRLVDEPAMNLSPVQ